MACRMPIPDVVPKYSTVLVLYEPVPGTGTCESSSLALDCETQRPLFPPPSMAFLERHNSIVSICGARQQLLRRDRQYYDCA